jgi:hypothetical protein
VFIGGNLPITNRVSSTTNTAVCPTGIECVTDAVASVENVDGGVSARVVGLLQSNLASGDTPASRNSVLFPAITIPAGSTKIIRISNIRVVAPPVASSGIPTQVFAFVSTNPANITIANANLPVAASQIGLQFTARNTGDTAAASLSFSQCLNQNAGTLSGDKTGTITFLAKFTEGFVLAFKTKAQESGSVDTVALGLTSVGGIAAPSSTATSGTKLMVRFSNIPAGVNIFVTNKPVATGTSAGIDANITSPSSSAATATIDGLTARKVSISNKSGSATWEITQNLGDTAQKSVAFGVAISFTCDTSAGTPGLTLDTPGAVAGLFAPVSDVNFASPDADIPRFVDAPQGAQVFAIVPCVTNLLFPFVTNVAGFDTGIALVNTSQDTASNGQPFATKTQHGSCTVYYFNGATTAPAPQTTADIAPGAMAAFTLQSGGVAGSTSSAAGFQGYIIARCSFQYAHGFAFISDRNTPSLGSQGYLALVIPDRGTAGRPASAFSDVTGTSGQGEQLGQ